MALTAAQQSELATAYEKAAADDFLSQQQRAEFAKKAQWFRLAAKMTAKNETTRQNCVVLSAHQRELIANKMAQLLKISRFEG